MAQVGNRPMLGRAVWGGSVSAWSGMFFMVYS